jgi:hypothetical protein
LKRQGTFVQAELDIPKVLFEPAVCCSTVRIKKWNFIAGAGVAHCPRYFVGVPCAGLTATFTKLPRSAAETVGEVSNHKVAAAFCLIDLETLKEGGSFLTLVWRQMLWI